MAECTNMVGHGWRCAAPTLCKECVLRNERNQLQTALAEAKAEHVRLEAERNAAREVVARLINGLATIGLCGDKIQISYMNEVASNHYTGEYPDPLDALAEFMARTEGGE